MKKDQLFTNHTAIINELKKSIKFYNWDFIFSFLPNGSFLVGGYIRDIILGRHSKEIDIDIVVPSNATRIGKKISDNCEGRLIILDKKRNVIRIILNHISIDIANQSSTTIEGDLKRRDFSINSIAFSFDNGCLIDPLDGIKDIQLSLLKTYSEANLIDDPLRILRCFRFVSELNFNIDTKLITFIKAHKEKLSLAAEERINYEIKRIVRGVNALESILMIQKFNIFGFEGSNRNSYYLDLEKINYEKLNLNEKKNFLPFFFIVQILDQKSLEKFKFSKSEIQKLYLLRKWYLFFKKRNISEFNEIERFDLHNQLEDILPSFICFLPQHLHLEWLNRWRDKNDKLFHPSNLINGNQIKKHLKIKDGPMLGKLLYYLSRELAFKRLDNFDEAIYKAKLWIEQNAPKCD